MVQNGASHKLCDACMYSRLMGGVPTCKISGTLELVSQLSMNCTKFTTGVMTCTYLMSKCATHTHAAFSQLAGQTTCG